MGLGRVSAAVLITTGLSVQAHAQFEQALPGQSQAWRSHAGATEMIVVPQGFALHQGRTIHQFRWDRSMQLTSVTPESVSSGNSYAFAGNETAVPLLRAERLRAGSPDRSTSVLYYQGLRGPEFDIQVEPGTRQSRFSLESLDADLSLDTRGRVLAASEPLLLPALAYAVSADGARRSVPVRYRLATPRRLVFEVGLHPVTERLIIDPVITYATYFRGSRQDEALGLKQMADGDVVLVGNTESMDLPQGASVSGLSMEAATFAQRCFVARLAPVTKKIVYVSYIGEKCRAADIDALGRVLVVGGKSPQYRVRRLSQDGRTLEYSTVLGANLDSASLVVRGGDGETAYLSAFCPNDPLCFSNSPTIEGGYQSTASTILVLRYNFATKQFDAKTFFDPGPRFQATLSGMTVGPGNFVYLFGDTKSTALPLLQPFQAAPPANGTAAGFVSGFTPDLRMLVMSSYLGGSNGSSTGISWLTPNPDGSLSVVGSAFPGSIPNLAALRPTTDTQVAPYAVRVMPGAAGLLRGLHLTGLGMTWSDSGLTLADGRLCVVGTGDLGLSLPGGVAQGDLRFKTGPLLGCLNGQTTDLDILTPAGSDLVVPSNQGGIWSLLALSNSSLNAIPHELWSDAIQPAPSGRPDGTSDLLLRHVDLRLEAPVLVAPNPVFMSHLKANIQEAVPLVGRNFSWGMQLVIGDQEIPVTVQSGTSASLRYQRPDELVPSGTVALDIPAGSFTGRLKIPTTPEPLLSEPFPILIRNLPPPLQPFTPGGPPGVFFVAEPLYDNSQVLWNGNAVPMVRTPEGRVRVDLPADIAPPGKGVLALINPPPGGGVQEQAVTITATGNANDPVPDPRFTRIPGALDFQVDRERSRIYTVASESGSWKISQRSMPDGTLIQSLNVVQPRNPQVVAFRLSPDGSFLYLTDNSLRVTRIRTESFTQDLQFQIPTDAPPIDVNIGDTRHQLRILADAPRSILITTPAGRLVIYDDDHPRPYTTSDFPALTVSKFRPLLASSTYVYAASPGGQSASPCLVRYPIDAFGFAPPEEFCDRGIGWGKYPEMREFNTQLILENEDGAVGIERDAGTSGIMNESAFDPIRDIKSFVWPVVFADNGQTTYRIIFTRMSTGDPIGAFPARSVVKTATGKVAYPLSVTFYDDDTLVYRARAQQGSVLEVAIVNNWRTLSQDYSH